MERKTIFKGLLLCFREEQIFIFFSFLFFFFPHFQNILLEGLHYTLVCIWFESIFQKRQPTLTHSSSVSLVIQKQTQRTVFNNLMCMIGWIQAMNLVGFSLVPSGHISHLAVGGLLNQSQIQIFIKRWINKEVKILLNAGQSLNQCNNA